MKAYQTFMLQTHKLYKHPLRYETHQFQQAFYHGRRTVQTNSFDVLKRYCLTDFNSLFG